MTGLSNAPPMAAGRWVIFVLTFMPLFGSVIMIIIILPDFFCTCFFQFIAVCLHERVEFAFRAGDALYHIFIADQIQLCRMIDSYL